MLLAAGSFTHFAFGIVLLLIAIFLILLVLVQRGRGGGLTGALGGMGGQSAFGTKAGDTFTRITYGTAIVWIVVCMLAIKVLHVGAPLAVTKENPTAVPVKKDKADETKTVPAKSGAGKSEKTE